MCVSDGSPTNPPHKEGMQELWDLLQKHDAVFLGDDKLKDELSKLLKEHQIKREKPTPKQKEFVKIIAKMVKEEQLVC